MMDGHYPSHVTDMEIKYSLWQIQIFVRSPDGYSFCSTYTHVCFENYLVSGMVLMIQSGVSFQVIPLAQITTIIYFHEKAFTSINDLVHEN